MQPLKRRRGVVAAWDVQRFAQPYLVNGHWMADGAYAVLDERDANVA
jgi:hypothetical protein